MITCLLFSGCGRDTPVEPTDGLDGTWRGTITRGATSGTITLQTKQSGAGVTGTWSADLDGVTFDQIGSVGGTVAGSAVSLFLRPTTTRDCGSGVTLSGTLAMNGSFAGHRLTGDYVVFTCAGVDVGHVDATRG